MNIEIPPPPPRPDFDSSREKLQKLGEGEGSMTAKEFNKMKLKLEAKYKKWIEKCQVVDENTGEILGPNQKGELCFKGPSLFKGYWNNPEATADIVKDGWIHTGDIGYYDYDGDVFYVQRSKELIKYLGHHVIPSQLEAILKSHPAVEDAAVVGIKSEDYGELPMAYAMKKPGHDKLDARRLVNFLHDHVHDESLLRGGLVFIDEIPRNVMGKIVRQQLRDQAELEARKPSSLH